MAYGERLEFKKSDPKVARLVRKCYPDYKGRRKVRVESQERYRASNYWDGGSRNYASYVHLPTGRIVSPEVVGFEMQQQGNPFNLHIGAVHLTPEYAVVENVIFCGKDLGIRIYLHPDTYAKW